MIFYHGEYFTIASDNIIINESNPTIISCVNHVSNENRNENGASYGNLDITDESQKKHI